MSQTAFHAKRNAPLRTPVRLPIGPPATARDALRRLEGLRTFDELVTWSHELRLSGLLGEDGYTNDLVRFWGRVCPSEVPPQAVETHGVVHLPSGEQVRYVGDWKHGQWQLLLPGMGMVA